MTIEQIEEFLSKTLAEKATETNADAFALTQCFLLLHIYHMVDSIDSSLISVENEIHDGHNNR